MKSHEIEDPITGEVVSARDIDSLIDAYERTKTVLAQLYGFNNAIKAAIAGKAVFPDGCKTARVRGKIRRCKVEQPSDSWDQKLLREIVANYPDLSREVVKPSEYRVAAREYAKITAESGPPKFMRFKESLIAANRGPIGSPSIVIEEDVG